MNFIKRMKNIWDIGGIEVAEGAHRDVALGKIAGILKNSELPPEPKRMATIIQLHPQEEDL